MDAVMESIMTEPKQPIEVQPGTSMRTAPLLKGQRALVTGASSGIGACLARAPAAAGAKVVVNYVGGRDSAEALVEEIRGYGIDGADAMAIHADVSKEDQVQAMFREMFDTWGSIDVLVNNAGLQQDAPFQDLTLAQWQKVIEVNLTGQFLCSREAVREFLRLGVVPEISRAAGKIICVSSVHEVIPYGRVGETRDLGSAAVWLASDHSDYVTGISLFVDGGMTLYPGFAEGA